MRKNKNKDSEVLSEFYENPEVKLFEALKRQEQPPNAINQELKEIRAAQNICLIQGNMKTWASLQNQYMKYKHKDNCDKLELTADDIVSALNKFKPTE